MSSFITSWIPTTSAAVTRATDIAVVQPLGSWFSAAAGSLMYEFDAMNTGVNIVGGFSDNTFNNSTYMGGTGATAVIGGVGSNASTAIPSYTGIVQKQALAYGASRFSSCANGGPVGSATMAAGPYPWTTYLVLGSAAWFPGANSIFGHMRRAQYWPRALADHEMIAVTAL